MKPITPGEILLEEYLKPLGLSQNALARGLGVSPRSVNEIVLGRRAITAEMSLRLGKFFGQSPRFWFGIQTKDVPFPCLPLALPPASDTLTP